jgi:predicted porin
MVLETGYTGNDPKVGPANQIGDRQSTIGLATQNGTIDLGRKWHSQGLALKASDPFNTLYGSIAVDVHNFHNKRSGDAVFATYKVGPATIAFDRTITATGPEAIGYSVSGVIGPATTTLAHFEQGADKSNVVSAQAVVFNTKVMGSYSIDDGLTTNTKGTLVSIVRGIDNTPLTIRAGYGVKTGLVTGDVKAFNMAADYALSKRTVTSLIYRNVSDVTDTKQVGVGLTHSF